MTGQVFAFAFTLALSFVELEGIEPSSELGNGDAFYMFTGSYCRDREDMSDTGPDPYAAL